MTDIIERLRDDTRSAVHCSLSEEAADEIERIRHRVVAVELIIARVQDLLNAQQYENDVLSVGQIRRALSFSGEQEPPRCNHWPGQKRCGVCGMDNTSPFPPSEQNAVENTGGGQS